MGTHEMCRSSGAGLGDGRVQLTIDAGTGMQHIRESNMDHHLTV